MKLDRECNVRPPIIHQYSRRKNIKEKRKEKELVENVTAWGDHNEWNGLRGGTALSGKGRSIENGREEGVAF